MRYGHLSPDILRSAVQALDQSALTFPSYVTPEGHAAQMAT